MKFGVGAFLAAMALWPTQGDAQGWFGAPIERQRIAPEPTPGLRIPPRPGRQTIILQDYAGHIDRSLGKSRTPLSPMALYIPLGIFARTSPQPHEAWGINLHVRYPEMRPFPARERTCWGWCDGYMLLSLANSSSPFVSSRFRDLHADIARQAAAGDPLVVYTPQEPSAGYTEAYDVTYVKWQPPETRRLYVKVDTKGEPVEFVECRPMAPSPGCTFLMRLDGLPQLDVEYSLSREFWDQRDEVRAAVQRLVRSFLSE